MNFAFPLTIGTYRISSEFGMRLHPTLGTQKMHNGIDFAAPTGTPVYSVGPGQVTIASYSDVNGNWVKVDHGNGWASAYLHLSSTDVSPGQSVKAGTRLGAVGTTGRSTGPHLHFILYKNGVEVDPLEYLSSAVRKAAPFLLVGSLALGAIAIALAWRYQDEIRGYLP